MHRLNCEVCKQILDDWTDSAAEYLLDELFNKKHFVTDEELVMDGSVRIYHYLQQERAKVFW
jgi:hypothetical protein